MVNRRQLLDVGGPLVQRHLFHYSTTVSHMEVSWRATAVFLVVFDCFFRCHSFLPEDLLFSEPLVFQLIVQMLSIQADYTLWPHNHYNLED